MSRLPRWVEYGALLLAMLAGIINAVGFLGFQHQAVSHLSGIATLTGEAVANLSPEAFHLGCILVSFLIGAGLSGYLIENTALRLGRHYSVALVLEGLLILAAMAALLDGSFWGHYFASAACGLQNGLVTRYSDAIVRTTHLTGIITDLGLMIGARLRGVPFDRRKAILFLLIVGGFIAGSGIGAILFRYLGFVALSIPAILAFVISALYGLYSYRRRVGDP